MAGCSPIATEYRKQGFDFIQKGFSYLPDSPDPYEEVDINNLTVIVVGSRDKFLWDKAKRPDSRILGYAEGKNRIYILSELGL